MKLDSRYADYFTEYSNYLETALRLLNYIYGMANYGKLFTDELTEWLLEAGFIQSKYQMPIYYKYATDRTIVLFHLMLMIVYNCILMKLLKNGLWIL